MGAKELAYRYDEHGDVQHVRPAHGHQFTPEELRFFLVGVDCIAQPHELIEGAAVLYSKDARAVYGCGINPTGTAAAGRPVYGPVLLVPVHLLPLHATDPALALQSLRTYMPDGADVH